MNMYILYRKHIYVHVCTVHVQYIDKSAILIIVHAHVKISVGLPQPRRGWMT